MKYAHLSCDIAIFGGGPAGLSAAITAARLGRSVLLVERNGYLGGSLAIGLSPLGFLDNQGRRCISGFPQEFFDRLAVHHDCMGTDICPKHNSVTCVNAEAVKILAAQLCYDEKIDVLLHCDVLRSVMCNGQIQRVILYGKGNEISIEAHQYIDCTGDGDLAYLCGCIHEMGQSDTGTLQPPTVMFALQNVNTDRLFVYLDEHPEELRYNDAAIYENPNYTTNHFRTHPSHVFVGLQATFRKLMEDSQLPVARESLIYINGTHPGEVYINTTRLLRTDATDLKQLARAELEGTLQVPRLINMLRERVPGFENCYLSSLAPSIGVRETRRFKGISRVTYEDAIGGVVPQDTICLSGYKIDIHSGTDTGLIFHDIREPFGIPFGCLVSAQVENLLFAGRCISCDAIAYGSLRVIPTCMAMGQAAAVGAHVALQHNVLVRNAGIDEIRTILKDQNAILSME